jgi:hypothetical protein
MGMDEAGLTLASIESEALSTCHFYLMLGYFDEVKFAYVFHSGDHYPASMSDASSNLTSNESSPAEKSSPADKSSKSNNSSTPDKSSKSNNPSPVDKYSKSNNSLAHKPSEPN